jgi:hypothetical protein
MSSPTAAVPSSPPTLAEPDVARRAPAWLREPLLHFLLIGAVVFAIDHYFVARTDDPLAIVVGAEVDREARETFRAARGSDPTAEQLAALRQTWLDNEVLYREGMAMRVDQGDTMIRDRIVFKALNVVESNLKLPAVDDTALRAWFEKNRAKYDEPARFDFQEAVLAGDNAEPAARALAAELNRGAGGEVKAGLRVFKGRPHANIVQSYGAEFAQTLETLPPGEWRPLRTREGWRVMRLEAIAPGKPAGFEALRGVVLQDWTDATMSEIRTTAVRSLAKKYKVRQEGAAS